MKKLTVLLLFILGIVITTSCNDNVTMSKEDYQKLKGDTIHSVYPKPFKLYTEGLNVGDDGVVLGSDNHEYLVYNFGSHGCNVEHYIDCKLCKDRESLILAKAYQDRMTKLVDEEQKKMNIKLIQSQKDKLTK